MAEVVAALIEVVEDTDYPRQDNIIGTGIYPDSCSIAKRKMTDYEHPYNALPEGYRLQEEYELVRVLGVGGFSITYLGFDDHLNKPVAIKEYLPLDSAIRTADGSVVPHASDVSDNFQWGLDRFVDEARTLARFDHRHIVKVHRYFEAHGTAYIVMDYVEGETLSAYLERKGTLSEAELERILYPLLEGLAEVHGEGILHRDIKPANIVIRAEDGLPVLIDFGAARQAIGERTHSLMSILTPGYAPIEQYPGGSAQGPWTDLYALGAVCYRALTGREPEVATERVRDDPLVPVSRRCAGQASARFLSAIDAALSVYREDRLQSVTAWRTMLDRQRPRLKRLAVVLSIFAALLIGGKMYVDHAEQVALEKQRREQAVLDRQRQEQAALEKQRREQAALEKQRREQAALEKQRREQAALEKQRQERQPGRRFKDCTACPEMVVVPTGSFMMGSPSSEKGRDSDEVPQHPVRIAQPFAVGMYEVTFAEWDECVSAGGCNGHSPADRGWGRGQRPVIYVSWNDAQAYVKWLSNKTGKRYRLLSEAEWEYVARAGTETPFHFGMTISKNQANYNRNYGAQTMKAGSFPSNRYGLYDVHGNVDEWVQDCWNDSYSGAPTDGSAWTSGDCSGRVLRGGSWDSQHRNLHLADRDWSPINYRSIRTGFRVARTF